MNNDAVELLSPEERNKNETSKVPYPRFVHTDKNDGARTVDNDLPIHASARLVVDFGM